MNKTYSDAVAIAIAIRRSRRSLLIQNTVTFIVHLFQCVCFTHT